LREEASEATRSESRTAIQAVADSYVELLLAWPRAWSRYGQRLSEGLLRNIDPLRLGPVDRIGRDLWSAVESAIDKGLRDHAVALTGILFRAGREAIEVNAKDLLQALANLAPSLLSRSSTSEDLRTLVNDRVCRAQVELAEYVAGARLRDDSLELGERQQA